MKDASSLASTIRYCPPASTFSSSDREREPSAIQICAFLLEVMGGSQGLERVGFVLYDSRLVVAYVITPQQAPIVQYESTAPQRMYPRLVFVW